MSASAFSVSVWFEYLITTADSARIAAQHEIRWEEYENYRIAWAAIIAFADEQRESA
jgi:hypothetical protein